MKLVTTIVICQSFLYINGSTLIKGIEGRGIKNIDVVRHLNWDLG